MVQSHRALQVSSVPDGVEDAEKLDVGHVEGAARMDKLYTT